MGEELLWLIRVAFSVYVAWRATVLIGVNNPLMGIFCAILLCIGAPIGLDMLLSACEDRGALGDVVGVARTLQVGAPLAFALIGAFFWSFVENVTGW